LMLLSLIMRHRVPGSGQALASCLETHLKARRSRSLVIWPAICCMHNSGNVAGVGGEAIIETECRLVEVLYILHFNLFNFESLGWCSDRIANILCLLDYFKK